MTLAKSLFCADLLGRAVFPYSVTPASSASTSNWFENMLVWLYLLKCSTMAVGLTFLC